MKAILLGLAIAALASAAPAQPQQTPAVEPALALFAVEIKVGPNWIASKPPPEQAHFREHSANLKRLRDSGSLVMGARYADKGLVVLAAANEAQVRAMLHEDPSMKAGVFQYEVHPFNVFYGGTVSSGLQRTSPR